MMQSFDATQNRLIELSEHMATTARAFIVSGMDDADPMQIGAFVIDANDGEVFIAIESPHEIVETLTEVVVAVRGVGFALIYAAQEPSTNRLVLIRECATMWGWGWQAIQPWTRINDVLVHAVFLDPEIQAYYHTPYFDHVFSRTVRH